MNNLSINSPIDWESFLSKHDLEWYIFPSDWYNAPFLGNGMLGSLFFGGRSRGERNTARIVLGRNDVTALTPHLEFNPRVPIGEFQIKFSEGVLGSFTRLNLWDAQVESCIETVKGNLNYKSFVHATEMTLYIEFDTTNEATATLHWLCHHELNNKLLAEDGIEPAQYLPEVTHFYHLIDDIHISEQVYANNEGGCVVAWKWLPSSNQQYRLICSIENGHGTHAIQQVISNIQSSKVYDFETYKKTHLAWWHDYYQQSFLSFNETRLEGYYWIQMYKLACATRSDSTIIDNQGPWFLVSPWAGTWWNLNVQLSYSPVYTANRLAIGESLRQGLFQHIDTLIANVPSDYQNDSAAIGRNTSHDLKCPAKDEVGNLMWACHNLWRHCRHEMNESQLLDHFFPLLKRAVNFYRHLMFKGEDGLYHLPPMVSPEYLSHVGYKFKDTHYDLALFNWGLLTLSEILTTYSLEDADYTIWQDILSHLVPYPTNQDGLLIGEDAPMIYGHRHYSHLLAIFPLHLITPETPEQRKLIENSLNYWLSLKGDMRGFSFVGAASIAAILGDGDSALKYIYCALDHFSNTTMYRESPTAPVMETPLACAESIHMLLLQSYGSTIKIFPAIPQNWSDISFHNLSAQGGFLVSAVRENNLFKWASITAQVYGSFTLHLECLDTLHIELSHPTIQYNLISKDTCSCTLNPGEQIIFYSTNELPSLVISPSPSSLNQHHFFGGFKPLKKY